MVLRSDDYAKKPTKFTFESVDKPRKWHNDQIFLWSNGLLFKINELKCNKKPFTEIANGTFSLVCTFLLLFDQCTKGFPFPSIRRNLPWYIKFEWYRLSVNLTILVSPRYSDYLVKWFLQFYDVELKMRAS